MDQLTIAPHFILEPYTIRLRLQSNVPCKKISPDSIITSLLHELAKRCMKQKGAVIGHIKGFAQKEGNGSWLKVSVTDDRHSPSLEGGIEDTTECIDLSLNAHVIGIKATFLEVLVTETWLEVEGRHAVIFTPIN